LSIGCLNLVTASGPRLTQVYDVEMRGGYVSVRRTAAGLGLSAVLAVVLCGCVPSDPGPPTGVRLNSNGTVDFVSCQALSKVMQLEGSTYRRHGWNHTIDDKTKVNLTLDTPALHSLAIGQIVSFSGIPAKWDSMYLDALGGSRRRCRMAN
jgi:hypothetical protein